ncbi:hypothetical protein [Streptomyces sp. NRRL S-1521]|nr:hypothetical protein [Streptomyces sp. NRRL S-1521]
MTFGIGLGDERGTAMPEGADRPRPARSEQALACFRAAREL